LHLPYVFKHLLLLLWNLLFKSSLEMNFFPKIGALIKLWTKWKIICLLTYI
jgi:hypothetical protein